MKKLIALLLVLTLAIGLAACGNTKGTAPASALEVMETIWNSFADNEKFSAVGGDMNNAVDGAPGKYDLADPGLTTTLLLPEDQIANVDEAASLMNAMMANNFTCATFGVADGADADALAEAMYTAITTNRWMCGMPEHMIIYVIGGEYVMAGFGLNDALKPFETKLVAAYPDAEMKYSEAVIEDF